MEQQKLDEIRQLAESMWEGCDGCDETDKQMWINGYITGALSNQIELVSDEDIFNATPHYDGTEYSTGEHHGFFKCAKWMRDKIQGGNK